MAGVNRKKEEKLIYCGPNLPGLSQFSIVTGMPNLLKLHIESCSDVEKLLVPIEELNKIRLKLVVKGSYERQLYIKIQNYLRGLNQ
ncbi:MAG: hypothetical protein AB9856_03495 [Cellulosilyticaceae bacterium]